MTAIAVQQLQRMQTRAQVAMRHVAKHRESTRVRRQMLPRTNLTQASRNERRRRAVAAHDLRHRTQRAQSRRIQVVADAHDRTQDRLALLAARRACPTLQEADERAHKARRAQRLAAARGSVNLVNHHERRTPAPMQAIRLERRAHAALDVGRRTCVTRIQLVHTIARVLCHHMRQRRLPQARRAGQEQHTLVRTPKLVGRALVHAARTRRIASKHTRVPCFDPPQHVAVQPIVAQQVGERARPILVHPHARVSRPHTPRLTHHIGRPRTHARHEHVQRLGERRRIRRRRRRTPCPDAPAPGYQDTRAV